MQSWLDQAMQGVDPNAPDASWRLFVNLMALMPWSSMFWSSVVFIAVGGWLGWRRGRLAQGIVWAFVGGPIGWWWIWRQAPAKPATCPPPLPGKRR